MMVSVAPANNINNRSSSPPASSRFNVNNSNGNNNINTGAVDKLVRTEIVLQTFTDSTDIDGASITKL